MTMTNFTSFQKALAIVPKCSSAFSFCSSIYIVQHVLRNRKRRNLTYHRLLCGMSISDLIGSFVIFLSTWPIPKGEAYLAAGTVQSCTAHGFFDQTAALCTPMYNVSLAIYYLLVIVKGWKERRISKIEKYLHLMPIIAGFGTGIAGLVLNLYNASGWICWIAPGLPNHPERHNPNYGIFRIAFFYAPSWAIFIFLAIAMTIIYFHVLKQERSLDKYTMRMSVANKKRNQSRQIRNQAFLYVGCMYMAWIFGSITRLMQFAGQTPPPAIYILFLIFFPLQGFFNLIVYMFPRIRRYFEKGTPLISNFISSTHDTFLKSRRKDVTETQVGTIGASSEVTGAEDGREDIEKNVTLAAEAEPKKDVGGIKSDNIAENLREEEGDDGIDAIDELANIVES